MRADAIDRRRIGAVLLVIALALPGICLDPAQAAAAGQPGQAAAPRHQAPRHATGSSLDDRVKLLTKGLGLDAKQQAELRKVLEDQREQVRNVWAETTVPGAYRIGETQAIENRTGDQIRALLNDEQKKKYNSAKPPRDAAGGSARPDVEYWMNPAKPKPSKKEDQRVERSDPKSRVLE